MRIILTFIVIVSAIITIGQIPFCVEQRRVSSEKHWACVNKCAPYQIAPNYGSECICNATRVMK